MFTKEITNGMMPARMNLTVISVFILPKKCLSGLLFKPDKLIMLSSSLRRTKAFLHVYSF